MATEATGEMGSKEPISFGEGAYPHFGGSLFAVSFVTVSESARHRPSRAGAALVRGGTPCIRALQRIAPPPTKARPGWRRCGPASLPPDAPWRRPGLRP